MRQTGSSLRFNFLMNVILAASAVLFPLAAFPYASRILLPEGIGKVSFAVSLISYFNMAAQLGVPVYGIRACAKVRDDKTELTRTAHELLLISLFMSGLSYAALAAALAFVPRLRQERMLYMVVSLTIFLNAVGMEWLYKALERYAYITARSVAFKLIALILLFLLVRQPDDCVAYGGITVLASSASYLCNLFHARRYIGMRPVGGYRFRRHLKAVLVFFAMNCSVLIYTQLDTVMLGMMAADADVGLYSAAVQIKTVLVSVTASLGNVLLPRASYYVEQGRLDRFRALGRKALHFVFVAASPMALFFILFAPCAIGLLSGPAYADAVPAARIIMPSVLLIGITNIMGFQVLIPLGREKAVLRSEIAGAATDLILNRILIPGYAAAGAAAGTLAAEAVVLAVQCAALKDEAKSLFCGLRPEKIALGLAAGSGVSVCAGRFILDRLSDRIAGLDSAAGCFLSLLVSGILFFGIYGGVLLLVRDSLVSETAGQMVSFLQRRIHLRSSDKNKGV